MQKQKTKLPVKNLILDSLEIQGFRGFRHLTIERLGRVNLIVGKNSVGKSALLEALRLYAQRGSIRLIRELLEERDEIRGRIRTSSNAGEIDETTLAVKYLFYGRKDIREYREAIKIG